MTADSIDPDTEIYELQLKLVHGFAQNALLDSQELLDAGWEVVPVVGSPTLLWRPPLGPLDGSLYTEQAALAEIRPVIGDEGG